MGKKRKKCEKLKKNIIISSGDHRGRGVRGREEADHDEPRHGLRGDRGPQAHSPAGEIRTCNYAD